jgi:hypothetical protein
MLLECYRTDTFHRGNDVLRMAFCKGYIPISRGGGKVVQGWTEGKDSPGLEGSTGVDGTVVTEGGTGVDGR